MMQDNLSNFELLKHLLKEIPEGDACLEWPRGRNKKGYGQLQTWNKSREQLVHRQAFLLAIGSIPDGLGVLHSCDNPPCFRPSHLFLGTQLTNMRDCANKKRWRNASTLEPEDIRYIRLMTSIGAKQQPLADYFGLHQSTVSDIVRRKHWKNL